MPTPAPTPVVLVIGSAAAPDLHDWLGTGGFDAIDRTPETVPEGLAGYAAAVGATSGPLLR